MKLHPSFGELRAARAYELFSSVVAVQKEPSSIDQGGKEKARSILRRLNMRRICMATRRWRGWV